MDLTYLINAEADKTERLQLALIEEWCRTTHCKEAGEKALGYCKCLFRDHIDLQASTQEAIK